RLRRGLRDQPTGLPRPLSRQVRAVRQGEQDHPPLRDAGTLGTAPLGYRRRTCCLYYRVPGGGLCGDCVLREAPGRGSGRGTPG
ncbi:(2Fe-2S)-binding protein, partial [Streptomyces asiaticus]